MTTNNLNQLAETLSIAFRQGADAKGFAPLFRQILLLLANGEPVSPEDIGDVSGLSHDEVVAFLPQLPNVELDDEGNLVGMGLTLRPTPHRFEVEGHSLFTWCALDALTFPFLLGKSAYVESPCRVTGTPVTTFVTPDGMEYVEPPGAVVSIVIPAGAADIRGSFCDQVHFFASAAAASDWLAQRPGAMILPAGQAYQLGNQLAQGLFSQNMETAGGSD